VSGAPREKGCSPATPIPSPLEAFSFSTIDEADEHARKHSKHKRAPSAEPSNPEIDRARSSDQLGGRYDRK